MDGRINWIEHNGKQILFYNFKDAVPGDILSAIKEAEGVLTSRPSNSVLALIDATDIKLDSESWEGLKTYAKFSKPYNKAAAVVGLSASTNFMLKSISFFTKRTLSTFKNIEDAKNWLAERG